MASSGPSNESATAAAYALLEYGTAATFAVRDGVVEFANPAALEIARRIGYPVDDRPTLVGVPLADLDAKLAAVHRDPTEPTEITVQAPDRQLTLRVRVAPAGEDVALRIVIVEDRSGFRMLEERLRERSAVLEAVIESLPFDFWLNDLDNRTVMQNSHSRTLWGEQFGAHMEEIQTDPRIMETWSRTNAAALEGEVQTGEITYRIGDTERQFRNIVAPVRDGDRILGIFGVNIDITDLKNALRDREMLLQELNHRVKNHLQMILSMINLQPSAGAETGDEALRRIEERVHAVYLVHDQLYAAGALHTIDLAGYVTRLVDGIRAGYGRPIEISGDRQSVPIEFQRAISVGIVLTELIVNGIKHGAPEAPIRVSLTWHETDLELTVENRIDGSSPADEGAAGDGGRPDGTGGLVIIRHVSGQLRGSLESQRIDNRYRATLRFPYDS